MSGPDFCARFSTLICQGDQSCCDDASKRFESASACESDLLARCESETLPLIEDARTGYDPLRAGQQLARLAQLVNGCDLEMARWFVDRSGFSSMYAGTVDKGGACTPANAEDAPAMLSCKDGVCRLTAPPLDGVCRAEGKALGETCFTHIECKPPNACSAPAGLAGTCVAPKAEGQSCQDGFSCASLYCEGAACVPATKNRVFCARSSGG